MVIGIGCLVAVLRLALVRRGGLPAAFNAVRLELARYLALGLEFQLAADILVTAVSPSWEEIGKLAAIAAIRTALNVFLGREMQEERAEERQVQASLPQKYPTVGDARGPPPLIRCGWEARRGISGATASPRPGHPFPRGWPGTPMRMAGPTLELDAAVAGAVVGCRQAVVDEAARGIAITQAPPFAWTDPDPCDLAQLPGTIPPVTQADVR